MSAPASLSPTEALWAHVLQKDKLQPRNLDTPQVPAAPVDRNATSTRILLYDTQARLEQFSSRADTMLKGMQDANHQLKTVGMLFEKDRDTLTNDMIDLVNRSQREIQKAVGQPAQEPQFLAFQEKLELRVEGLNQRLDALQMFNQTHCQALETQSQILKSIQDQQNALLSAVLPLLPLAQAFPPQFDQIKASVREANETLVSTVAELKQDLTGSLSQLRTTSTSQKRRLSGSSTGRSTKRPCIELPESPSSTSTKSDEKIPHSLPAQPTLPNPVPLLPNPVPLPGQSPALIRTAPVISSSPRTFRQRSAFATPQHKPTIPFPVAPTTSSRDNPIRRSPFLLQRITSPSQKVVPGVPRSVLQTLSISAVNNSALPRTPSKSQPPTFGQTKAQLSNTKTLGPQLPPQNISQKSNILPADLRKSTLAPSSASRPPRSFPAQPSINAALPPKPQGHSALNLPAGLTLHPTPTLTFRNQARELVRDGRRFIPLDDDDDDEEEDDET